MKVFTVYTASLAKNSNNLSKQQCLRKTKWNHYNYDYNIYQLNCKLYLIDCVDSIPVA